MKAKRIQLIAVVLLGTALSACGAREQPLPEDVRIALQTHYNSADAEGAAELFTNDGALMREFGPPVRGKEAITQYLQVDLKKQLQYWLSSEGSAVSGNIAYDQGNYRVRDINKLRDLETGKYVSIYKKDDGKWKIFRVIYNSDSESRCPVVQPAPAADCAKDAKAAP